MAAFDFITRPIRGIGRLARGKWREGLGDLGEGVKAASLPLSFINPALGGLARGAGEVMDAADNPGGIGKMKLFKDAIAPAALTAGAGYAAKGIGALARGGGAPASLAPGGPMPGMPMAATSGVAAPAATSAAAPITSSVPGVMDKARNSIGSIARGVRNFAVKNPVQTAQIAQAGLNAYGQYEQGSAMDQEREEEKRRRRMWSELLGPVFQ